MVKLSKELLRKLVENSFFDDWKTIEDVVKKLDQKGYSVKGKQVSLLSQLLTFLCREDLIEREKNDNERWKYKKVGAGQHGN